MKRSNYVRLNNEEHKDILVDESRAIVAWKVTQNCNLVFDEIFSAAGCFPIFFMKNPSNGEFMITPIFSLRSGVNLFIDNGRWRAPYCPLNLLRYPFAVSQDSSNEGTHDIFIDLNEVVKSEGEGLRLFSSDGGETAFLKDRKQILGAIVSGKDRTQQFIDTLQEFDLLSEMILTLDTVGGRNRVAGLYAIDHYKMKTLSNSSYDKLIARDMLEPIYQIKASTAQISRLIWLENEGATNSILGFSLSPNDSASSL